MVAGDWRGIYEWMGIEFWGRGVEGVFFHVCRKRGVFWGDYYMRSCFVHCDEIKNEYGRRINSLFFLIYSPTGENF